MGRGQLKRELAGIGLLVLGAFVVGAILVERSAISGCTDAGRLFGPVGACTRGWLVELVGIPAALLLPAAGIVHGLSLLGRLEPRTDRSWLVLLLGAVVLLPVVVGLAVGGAPDSALATWAGNWGLGVAYYMARAFGTAGAWLLVLLALSALTVTTLAWNPLRALFGTAAPRAAVAGAGGYGAVPAALLKEPPPEEMPAMERRYVAEALGAAAAEPEADVPAAEERARRDRKPRGKAAVAAAE